MAAYMTEFYERVERMGIMPVVVLEDARDALPLARALVMGDLPSVEITFRTPAAADAIRSVVEDCPEILVGAGTILSIQQARVAVRAGAKFIVSPGYDMGVVRWCLEREVPVIPAGVTPTEVTELVNAGLNVTKFFPAEQSGGLGTIRALASVFVGHRFMPTGGVGPDNLTKYLSEPSVVACGGTWVTRPDLIRSGCFDKVGELAAAAAAMVASVRR